ncbi:hypothetical protein [Streptomyces lunaelactis]|uniref:hypothetical protein n=1 Tax=Streptomyces lunaelactis TaxID=1535768 RepID=UPI0015858F3D|nr:hypothetical protein [Streptomyces lunaelactis]NUK00458.1 hypothetical protein [Streptomyces lunaelactis]NUK13834.1 hypothetical protein [Streptomyces lunaelactis]
MAGPGRLTAKATGDGHAEGAGAFINTGVIDGDVILPPVHPAVSGYLHQVRRLAADCFQGREQELAAMAAFCTASDPHAHEGPHARWWRWLAPAWAGKTALMAHFVLTPPPNVVVVSFFITARLAGQNNRSAFCEVVQRQLYALLGEEEPPTSEHTRDEHLLHAFDRAAARCAAHGERLVLVVDGLDEDRGVARTGDGHSVAALLPSSPPHNARILVAGRPHPPVPNDVPGGHPLHTHEINHRLERSPHAAAVRAEAENSLDAMLETGGLPCELLGLIAAAGGGLTADDLAHLTGNRPLKVRRTLAGATGRIFLTSPPIWAPDGKVYLLGHEEIQATAMEMLSDTELRTYRDRLHAWADLHRANAWPVETPEYLLRGYTSLLRATRDRERMVALAADPARHERLWLTTGSDLEALTEITGAFDLHCAGAGPDGPDISTALVLAIRRDTLHGHSKTVPAELVAAWSLLDHTDRAISLALAHPDQHQRVRTLVRASTSLVGLGSNVAAQALAEPAVAIARALDEPSDRVKGLAQVAEALAEAGALEQALDVAAEALEIARAQAESSQQANFLIAVARAVSSAGKHVRAPGLAMEVAEISRTVDGENMRVWALSAAAETLAGLGRHEQVTEIANEIIALAPANPNIDIRALMLHKAALAMAQAGHPERAAEITLQAIEIARTLADPERLSDVLADIAGATARVEQYDLAVETARSIVDAEWQAKALADIAGFMCGMGQHERALELARTTHPVGPALSVVAEALSEAGRHERAIILATEAAETARVLDDPQRQAPALGVVAHVLARAGHHERAARIARTVTDPERRSRTMAVVASIAAKDGLRERATELASEAAAIGRAVNDPEWRSQVLGVVADAMAVVGHHEGAIELAAEAEKCARTIAEASTRDWLLTRVVVALARAGEQGRAGELVRTFHGAEERSAALIHVLGLMEECEQWDELAAAAVESARAIAQPRDRSPALANVACALHHKGHHEYAEALANEAVNSARTLEGREYDWALGRAAEALARMGQCERAAELVRTLAAPAGVVIRGFVASAIADVGCFERAVELVTEAVEIARSHGDLSVLSKALVHQLGVLAATGNRPRAVELAADADEAVRALPVAWQADDLVKMAAVMAAVGNVDRAIEFAGEAASIPEFLRPSGNTGGAWTLVEAAHVCGATAKGREFTVDALQTAFWLDTFRILPALAPEAIPVAAHCLLDEASTSRPW